MTPTPPTPKERFLSDELRAKAWTETMFRAESRAAIEAALLDYIQTLPLFTNPAAAGMMIAGATAFAKHLALIGVARAVAQTTTASELEAFDPQQAERNFAKRFQGMTTSMQPPTNP